MDNNWRKDLEKILNKAEGMDMALIVQLSMAAVRKEVRDAIVAENGIRILREGQKEDLVKILDVANDRELRVITRLAAAVVGREKQRGG